MLRYIVDGYPGVNPLAAAGDTYFLYDPDRDLPPNRQLPFATLVTGDRHDRVSDLDREGVYRLNIGVRKQTYRDLFGTPPTERDADGVLRHRRTTTRCSTRCCRTRCTRGSTGCACCRRPRRRSTTAVRPLLDEAYRLAVRKHENQAARRRGLS